MRATLTALCLAILACKGPTTSTLKNDGSSSSFCNVRPQSADDNLIVPKDADLQGCDDATLQAEERSLEVDLGGIDKRLDALKAPMEGDAPASGGKAATSVPVNKTTPEGLGLTADAEAERQQRELDALRADIERLQDRYTAMQKELTRRRGDEDENGICVYVRGDRDITSCNTGRTRAGCRAYSPQNGAFFYRFGSCDDFKIDDDYRDLLDAKSGACVRLDSQRKIASCAAAVMKACFKRDEDYLTVAFRGGKECKDFRTGAAFEGLRAPTSGGRPRSSFETDCRNAGGIVQKGNSSAVTCTCGSSVTWTESIFYDKDSDECRRLVREKPVDMKSEEVKTAFRRACLNGEGRASDDAHADGGMNCTCGKSRLPLRVFFDDYKDNNVNGFEQACRRAARDGGRAPVSAPSAAVSGGKSGNGGSSGSVTRGRCSCTWDSARTYCVVFKDGKPLAPYFGPVSANDWKCGTATGTPATDLCYDATLQNLLNGSECR